MQSSEIVGSLMTIPNYKAWIQDAACWNRWQAILILRPTTDEAELAAAMQNWDQIQLEDPNSMKQVKLGKAKKIQRPPFATVTHHAAISGEYIINELHRHMTITQWTRGFEPGELIIRLDTDEMARQLYGYTIPCPPHGMTIITTGDPVVDSMQMRERGTEQKDLLERVAGQQPRTLRLTEETLQSHQMGNE